MADIDVWFPLESGRWRQHGFRSANDPKRSLARICLLPAMSDLVTNHQPHRYPESPHLMVQLTKTRESGSSNLNVRFWR